MIDLDMSPYAAFVWPAWAITAIVLGALVARALTASRRWTAELKGLEQSQPEARPAGAQAASDRVASDSPSQP